MDTTENSRVVALAAPKDAALYFKYVLPVCPYLLLPDLGDEDLGKNLDILASWIEIYRNLLPPEFHGFDNRFGLTDEAFVPVSPCVETYKEMLFCDGKLDLDFDRVTPKKWKESLEAAALSAMALARKGGFNTANLMIAPLGPDQKFDPEKTDPSITLANLRLVDTSRLSWEKLLELRKDKDAVSRLRDLRLFFRTNYEGQERNFIVDDLARLVDEYERSVKTWDLDTRDEVLGVVFSPESIMAKSVAFLGSILSGEPLASILSATAAVSCDLGRISLKIGKMRRQAVEMKFKNPVSYIVEARNACDQSLK